MAAADEGVTAMATQIIVPIHEYFTPLLGGRSLRRDAAEAVSRLADVSTPGLILFRAVVHMLVGTLMFAFLIALPIAGLYIARRFLADPGVASQAVRYISYALAACDLLLFVTYLFRSLRTVLTAI